MKVPVLPAQTRHLARTRGVKLLFDLLPDEAALPFGEEPRQAGFKSGDTPGKGLEIDARRPARLRGLWKLLYLEHVSLTHVEVIEYWGGAPLGITRARVGTRSLDVPQQTTEYR